MAKKKSAGGRKSAASGSASFNPEKFRYYFPVLVLVLLIGLMILFGEFIFSDKMLAGSDTINAGIFFRHFYVEYFKAHGSVPLWNPYIFGGMPFIDAFHGDTFYPLSALKFVINFYRALGLNLILHILLAGIFMYFTARQFRLSRVASTLSAVAYGFSGYLVSFVSPGHDGKIFVTTLFPLTILFLDRAFERKAILNFALLGLVIGLIILSPHPQMSYYTLWALALYGIYKLVRVYLESKSVIKVIKPGAMLAGAVVIGLFISAVQFYPGYVYTTEYSPRADTKRGYEWATSWSMNAEEAFSQLVPEFSGVNAGEGNYYWGKNAFKDNSEYAGIIPLFLALIGIFFGRRREAIFFGCLALFAFIYALGGSTPIFRIFYYLIPKVKSLRAPSMIMFMFVFSVSLLAGMGLQYLIDKGRELSGVSKKRLTIYLVAVPSLFLVFALVFSASGEALLSGYCYFFYGDIKSIPIGQGDLTRWNLALINLPKITGGLWVVFLLTAATAAAIFLYRNRKMGVSILLLIPLLTMVDGIRFNSRFVDLYDPNRDFASNALTDHIKSLPGKFRVVNFRAVNYNFLPFHDIEVITGYHGNQLRWYDDLLGGPGQKSLANPNFLNIANAKYILAPSNAGIPLDYFGPDSLVVDGNFARLTLFRNDNALPRAYLVDNYEVIPDRQDIYPLILSGSTDMHNFVYVEKEPPLDIRPTDSALFSAEIVSYGIDSVLVKVSTPVNALLVLSDNYFPAWEAFVDGEKTEILRANGSFRAVPVKAGAQSVLFKYSRAGNDRVKWLSILTLILVAIILIVYFVNYLRLKRKEAAAT